MSVDRLINRRNRCRHQARRGDAPRYCRATLLLAALAAAAPAVPADDLGRLFFDSEQRARLDARRATMAEPPAAPDAVAVEPEVPEFEPAPPAAVTLNGFVQRSRGPATVWLNGIGAGAAERRALIDAAPAASLSAAGMTLVPEAGAPAVRLKPGQTWDPRAGSVVDTFRYRDDGTAE